jgi:hypothetical protein
MFNCNPSDGKETKQVVDQVKRSSSSKLISTDHRALNIISENQLRENIRMWLSPPDPSTNHNIACDTHHKKTATWFFQGSIFREWKSTASPSLLWIHGKRAPPPISYSIPSDDISNVSWLRQEYSLVSGCLALSIIGG